MYMCVALSTILQGFLSNERENTLLAAIEQSRKNVSQCEIVWTSYCSCVYVDICRG